MKESERKIAPAIESDQERTKRRRVRARVKYAIRSGKLKRPDRCSECGKTAQEVRKEFALSQCFIEAHHVDYDKPFDIEWLCTSCHMARGYERNFRQSSSYMRRQVVFTMMLCPRCNTRAAVFSTIQHATKGPKRIHICRNGHRFTSYEKDGKQVADKESVR